MYEAKVLADSVSPDGVRLTTLEVEYPHAIHKDIMTHCMLSRNFQSFRAFPPEKVIEKIERDPFIPEVFEGRVAGMGQGAAIGSQQEALKLWRDHIDYSLNVARIMIGMNLAKAQVNFVLQDLTSIRGIITATEWDNFWDLRLATHPETGKPMARPEVYKIASMMKQAYDMSQPRTLFYDEWHAPLTGVDDDWCDGCTPDEDIAPGTACYGCERDWDKIKKLSTGRCARVSYLTHDGVRDVSKDVGLHDGLKTDKHMSPFEHVARPILLTGDKWLDEIDAVTRKATGALVRGPDWRGKLYGWHPYRLDIEGTSLRD